MVRWMLTVLLLVSSAAAGQTPVPAPHAIAAASRRAVIPQAATSGPHFSFFVDPDEFVSTKEFSLFYNRVPDSTLGPGNTRPLFHLMYQRSGGPQAQETVFGHAWSSDLTNWSVDTLAFTIDGTPWNSAHVWSPSLIHHGSKDYMFYTGVDQLGNQRIGYATTDLLDTTNTVWDSLRVMVLEASNTRWAVPNPWMYSYQTQFRDPHVLDDPEHPGQLLMFYAALDSLDFKLNSGSLAVGVARSAPGTLDTWEDLGFFASTLRRTTHVGQLEGPHVFPVNGTDAGWRLMFSSAGSPPGEQGESTIRFEMLSPGASPADTAQGIWGAPQVLMQYLNGDEAVFGWSGSEALRADGVDYLAGFTAWGPLYQGIAITGVLWHGDDFTLERPAVTAVNEYRSPASGVRMSLSGYTPRAGRVTFLFDSPLHLPAQLEVFDTMGRRLKSLLGGTLPKGRSSVSWDLSTRDGMSVPSGVYFARLSFAGGIRAARIPVVR